MVAEVENEDQIKAKQLSHNSITGKDDEIVLKKLYDSIKDLEMKYYSGLKDQLDNIDTISLNFKTGDYKEFAMLFLPEDIGNYDELVELVEESIVRKDTACRLVDSETHKQFINAMKEIKGCENIKSNAAAFSRIIELALEKIQECKESQ